jgi:hypothetical protein
MFLVRKSSRIVPSKNKKKLKKRNQENLIKQVKLYPKEQGV